MVRSVGFVPLPTSTQLTRASRPLEACFVKYHRSSIPRAHGDVIPDRTVTIASARTFVNRLKHVRCKRRDAGWRLLRSSDRPGPPLWLVSDAIDRPAETYICISTAQVGALFASRGIFHNSERPRPVCSSWRLMHKATRVQHLRAPHKL